MKKKIGAIRAPIHVPPRVSAEDKVELTQGVLGAADAASSARATLLWLGRHTGVTRALCALVNEDTQRLEGIAGDGVAHARVEAFSLSLEQHEHPLLMVLAGCEPVFFHPHDEARGKPFPKTPLGSVSFCAVPLVRPTASEGLPLGLLLLAGLEGSPDAAVTWAVDILSTKLTCFGLKRAIDAERRLKRERWLLQSIIDAVSDPILLTDSEGRMSVSNAHAEKLFFAAENSSQGRRRAVALNNMLLSAALFTATEHTAPVRREAFLVDPISGDDLLFELLGTTVYERSGGAGVVSVLRNVSDLRRATQEIEANYRKLRLAEAEVRAERDRLDLILDAVADPILVTDEAGRIVRMNPPAEWLFTANPVAADAPQVERRIQANDAVFSSFVASLYTGHSLRWRAELSLVEPTTGAAVSVEAIAGKVLSRQGDMAGVVTILHDRREALEKARLYEQVKRYSDDLREKIQEATAELLQQNELLRRQALALEQASTHKSQFLANMSHELRTPLNAIIGYTKILVRGICGAVSPLQAEKLSRVEANAQHLLGLINDLLDIHRIEAGKMPLHLEYFDLRQLISEVVADVEPLIARTRLKVSRHLADAIPRIYSDRQKCKQIVLNLLSNALKFTPEGFVQVRASYDERSERIAVSVTDTGIGISQEDQARIFEAFRQVDGSLARQYGGTGLGLSICRRLAEEMGGEITLASKLGAGSTFTLYLPLEVRPKDEHELQETRASNVERHKDGQTGQQAGGSEQEDQQSSAA